MSQIASHKKQQEQIDELLHKKGDKKQQEQIDELFLRADKLFDRDEKFKRLVEDLFKKLEETERTIKELD